MTPAGALTQVLGWPPASPRVSSTRHHLLSAESLTGDLARRCSQAPSRLLTAELQYDAAMWRVDEKERAEL